MSSGIARKVIGYFQKFPETKKLDLLSQRENEVLILLSEGKLYKEIGDKLKISLSTVKKHLKNVYFKLHVQNKVEAVIKWREQ